MKSAATINMPLLDRMTLPLHPQDGRSTSTTCQRTVSPSIQLGPSPKFHPTNFPSSNPPSSTSSSATSPASTATNLTAPSSPKQQFQQLHNGRQYIDIPQRQLFAQQKDMVTLTRYVAGQSGHLSPNAAPTSLYDISNSPRLQPRAGSPSPMTPLDLEDRNGYFVPGARSPKQTAGDDAEEVVEATAQARSTSPISRRATRSPRFMTVKKGDISRHRSHLSR